MTVSAEQRAALARAVSGLRRIVEADYAALAEGKFGIHLAGRRVGEIEDAAALSLSAHDLAARSELVGVVEYLRGEGLGAREAVERTVREAVFTTVNRLLAIRVAEAIGVLPSSLVAGNRSEGFVEAVEAFPLLRDADDSGGYWTYLQICGDELSHAVPRLFDRRHPLSALVPSADALDEAVGILSDPVLAEVWVEPEALGWSYQFFNSQEERRAMRDASSAPRDSRELAVRNQFFTPNYVVDFLVQNTLGRILREGGSELELPLLVGEVSRGEHEIDLGTLSILDPAVGSGHFLLGAYELLERAWQELGIPKGEAASKILSSLSGIDIDPRASQVAQAVLYLRARRSAPGGPLDPPTIATARALPQALDGMPELQTDEYRIIREFVEDVSSELDKASELGSLLRPERALRDNIRLRFAAPKLGDNLPESPEALGSAVLRFIEAVAHRSESTPSERMFAGDATDAWHFIALLTDSYDVVLTNPPFGAPVEGTDQWLRSAYPDTWTDLYAAFLSRASELASKDGALVGAITSSQFMSTRTMRKLRMELITERNPLVIVDLGPGVLMGATVNTCLTVLPGGHRLGRTAYSDLTGQPAPITTVTGSFRQIDLGVFKDIRGTPLALHLSDEVLARFSDECRMEPDVAQVRSGSPTFNDFRFLRLRVELPEFALRDRWVAFPKGGAYQPFLAPAYLVVDWADDGRVVKEAATERVGTTAQVMQGQQHWFHPALTYMHVSSIGFNTRLMPAGEIFSKESIAIVPEDEDLFGLLGLLNTTPVEELLQAFGRNRKYENGALKGLPIGSRDVEHFLACNPPIGALVRCFSLVEMCRETSPIFVAPSMSGSLSISDIAEFWSDRLSEAMELQAQLDECAAKVLGFDPAYLWTVQVKSESIASAIPEADSPEKSAAQAVLSYLLGVAIGRWDPRVASDPSAMASTFDPVAQLPAFQPGSLSVAQVEGSGDTVDDLLRLPPNGILHDEAGSTWDVVSRIEAAATLLQDDYEEQLSACLRILKNPDLRSYLRKRFFTQHVRTYSRSQRKAPIYWYLATPSQEWGLWAYALRLTREQLFAISHAAQKKLHRLRDQVAQWRRDLEDGAGRELRDRLEASEDLIREIAMFHEKAEAVAQSGWEPDLSDGIILNAAPLEELFADARWRKDVSVHRTKMERGQYPWATVQRQYFDRLQS